MFSPLYSPVLKLSYEKNDMKQIHIIFSVWCTQLYSMSDVLRTSVNDDEELYIFQGDLHSFHFMSSGLKTTSITITKGKAWTRHHHTVQYVEASVVDLNYLRFTKLGQKYYVFCFLNFFLYNACVYVHGENNNAFQAFFLLSLAFKKSSSAIFNYSKELCQRKTKNERKVGQYCTDHQIQQKKILWLCLQYV